MYVKPNSASRCCGGNPLLKLRVGARKGEDAETVAGGLDLARRAKNRRNLGRTIPCTRLFFQKSGSIGLRILGVHI